MGPPSWDIASASLLLKTLLPDLCHVASHYATSKEKVVLDIRDFLAKRNPYRPFHVTLSHYLSELQKIISRWSFDSLRQDYVTVLAALLGLLDILDDYFFIVQENLRRFNAGRLAALQNILLPIWRLYRHQPGTYSNLVVWTASGSYHREHGLIQFTQESWFQTPPLTEGDRLLNAIETLTLVMKRNTVLHDPEYNASMDDDLKPQMSSDQSAARRKMLNLCNNMEIVHKQLAKPWGCGCISHEKTLYLAMNPCEPLTEDSVITSVLHKTAFWRQMGIRLKCAQVSEDAANYEHLCNDLRSSEVETTWYTLSASARCAQPTPFSRLLRSIEPRPLPKERLALAIVLSHLYLHLSGGGWWPYELIQPPFEFQMARNMSSLPISSPFFLFRMEPAERASAVARYINPGMPSLPAFGRLLLEILTWAPCSWEDNNLHQRLQALKNDTDLAHVDLILAAVTACLGERDTLRASSEHEGIRLNESKRKQFVDTVISNLEHVIIWAYGVNLSSIFSDVRPDGADTQRLRTQSLEPTSDSMDSIRPSADSEQEPQLDANTISGPVEGHATRRSADILELQNDDTGDFERVDPAW